MSTDKTPGDVSTLNGIGRKFYGSADPCPDCASVTRTLWFTFIELPVFPLGSYRYKTAQESAMKARFWCRQVPRHWPQIFKTWAVGILLGGAVMAAVILYEAQKK